MCYTFFDNFLTTFYLEIIDKIDKIDNKKKFKKVVKGLEAQLKPLICQYSSVGRATDS